MLCAGRGMGLAACGARNTASNVEAPGAPVGVSTRVLDAGADALQARQPVAALNAYLGGFHFYNGKLRGQMEAHHYCGIVNEELIQCVIDDGNVKGAKLTGGRIHRQRQAVPGFACSGKSAVAQPCAGGQLIAPGIPAVAEKALMQKLVATYGNTWHTWHTDRHKTLPLGVPQLMMGFTNDGQADAAMVAARDRRFHIDSAEKRRQRADIATPAIVAGADAWQHGTVIQLADPTGMPHGASSAPPPTR